jgi:hypothetical protein
LTDTRSPLSALTGSAFGSSAASTAEENDDNTTPVEPENGLPEAAYYGLIGEYLKAVAPLTEADPAGILACVLTGVGSALGRRVHHRTGRRHSGNLFTLLIGSTASRKGTCWSVASELLTQADPDWMAACVEGGFGSGEGLVHRIRDASEKDTGVPDKRLLVVEEEFAKPLRLCRSEKSTLSPLIRYAFDGSPLTIMNRGENRYGCREPHVGVIGMTTADELRELLKGRSELANGTLNRFLMIGCRRAGYLPLGGDYWRIAEDFGPELRAVLAAATDKPLTLDSAAAELWSSEYRRLEAEREGDYGKAVARLSVHALKVALIYAVVDGSTVIGLLHLKAALALIDYADRSAEGVFARNPNPSYGGEPLGGGEPSHAKLLAFVKSRGAEGITKREAHKLFNGHRKAEGLNADFATLVAVGLIVEACGRWYATEYRPTGCCGDTDDTDTGEHESGERQPAPPDTGSPDTALRSPCSPHSGDCNTGMTTPANNQTPVEPLDTQPTTERGFL